MNAELAVLATERNDSLKIPLDAADDLNTIRQFSRALHFAILGFGAHLDVSPLSMLASDVEDRLDRLTRDLGTRGEN